jgi:hypothetical protein
VNGEAEHGEHPPLIVRNGRVYRRLAVAVDASLYQSEQPRGRDFWLLRPDGGERPWNYRTQFGRNRPLPPPTGHWQRVR